MILSFVITTAILLFSITIHEFSHAYVADKLGDPTPRAAGRLTLNPLAHIDPIGILCLIFFHIGWAKPVPIDSFNVSGPKDQLKIALAGPTSNLLTAIIVSLFIRLFPVGLFVQIGQLIIAYNVLLAIFNLVPIYPLDGFHVVYGLLKDEERRMEWLALSRYGIIILLLLIMPIFNSDGLLFSIIAPITHFLNSLLIPGGII